MISPNQLTAENGFVEGCVVEIEFRQYNGTIDKDAGYLHIESETELWLNHWNDESIEFSDIISIRPLTGPMAIWNHAPEWAMFCKMWDGSFVFMKEDERKFIKRGDYVTYSKRPFWAGSKE